MGENGFAQRGSGAADRSDGCVPGSYGRNSQPHVGDPQCFRLSSVEGSSESLELDVEPLKRLIADHAVFSVPNLGRSGGRDFWALAAPLLLQVGFRSHRQKTQRVAVA